jgi:hypothetical protein
VRKVASPGAGGADETHCRSDDDETDPSHGDWIVKEELGFGRRRLLLKISAMVGTLTQRCGSVCFGALSEIRPLGPSALWGLFEGFCLQALSATIPPNSGVT